MAATGSQWSRLAVLAAGGLIGFGLLSGCGKEEASYVEVQEVVQADPHAGHDHAAHAAAPMAASQLGFTYTLPTGWSEKPPSSMVLLSLQAGDTPQTIVKVSVSAFPGDVGGQLANVNRWRRQVGLGPIEAAALGEFVKPVSISGMDAWQVDLTGQGGEMRMVVSAVFHNGETWFFKLAGSADAVASALAGYQSYLESVKF